MTAESQYKVSKEEVDALTHIAAAFGEKLKDS